MKKMFLLTILLLNMLGVSASLNNSLADYETQKCDKTADVVEIANRSDTTLTITQIWNIPGHQVEVCANKYDRVLVYAPEGCNDFGWLLYDEQVIYNESPIIFDGNEMGYHWARFLGCGYDGYFDITFINPNVPNETTTEFWKRPHEIIALEAPGGSYTYHWNTGETTQTIEVTEPGTYTCGVSDMCATSVQTFIVRNNVEIYRATIDLETNLNKVTWPIIPGQDEYISEVKAYRDGLLVGTVPYEQGYFMDNLGSDNAARNYHLVAVTTDGEESPVSYQKGTIHTTYYQDVNNNLNMTWNIPYVEEGAQGTLTYFQICKYDPNTGEITVVDQVNSLITDYTCGVNQFEGGYPVIAAVFSDSPLKGGSGDSNNRDYEDRSFSNMYTDLSNQPHEITITLMPGWNWISYPYAVAMNIATALGDFVPMSGDIINSQNGGTTTFVNGQWRGQVTSFTPGLGYMYYSARIEPETLVFGESRKMVVK